MKHQIDRVVHCWELTQSLTMFYDLVLARLMLLKSNQCKNVSGRILKDTQSPVFSVSSERWALSRRKLLSSSQADVELDLGTREFAKAA